MASKAKKQSPKKVPKRSRAAKQKAAPQRASEVGPPAGRGLLTMDHAIEMLKTTRPTFYRWLRAGKVRGMKVGRQWRFERAEIERFLKGEQPRIELRADIKPLLKALGGKAKEVGANRCSLLAKTDVQQVVKLMIELGVALGASDMHLSPHVTGQGQQKAGLLRYRIDGTLHTIAQADIRILPALTEQWKLYGAVDPRARRPQDARIIVETAKGAEPLDMRVSYLPTPLGDSLTVRFLKKDTQPLSLERIDFSPRDKKTLLQHLQAPWGFILVTGPTGSGKTTALYACLNHLASPAIKVVTIEDPVEYLFPWMVQTQTNEAEGMTFALAGRAALRSDPDVIMLGELRNCEVAMLSLQMSLTGHLVFSTLHADDAPRALIRLVEMGCPAFVVGDASRLIISQRLVRKLCGQCSEPAEISGQHLARATELAAKGGVNWDSLEKSFRGPAGCDKCKQIGYRGRTVIAEMLEVTPQIGEALRRGASVDELRAIAVGQGMTTMAADGVRRAAAGQTTLDEVLRVLAT